MKVLRERNAWPHPINTVPMQERMARSDRTVLQGCVFLGCGPGYVNKDHSGCYFSGSILDTRERQRGKDKGKLWTIFSKCTWELYFSLRTWALSEPLCGCSPKLANRVKKIGKHCNSSTAFPMEADTPKCCNTSVWSLTNRNVFNLEIEQLAENCRRVQPTLKIHIIIFYIFPCV